MLPARASFYGGYQVWILFEQLKPDTRGRLLDALHCNMASATIGAAMTSVGETKLRQDHRFNDNMRNPRI
jgi:hypothetical protein